MRSFGAVLLGTLLALAIGLIVFPGIVGPLFSVLLSPEMAERMAFPAGVLVFGLAFYFGGMLASYKAPYRRRMHGVAVALISFVTAVVVNFGVFFAIETQNDPIANFRTLGGVLSTATLFGVSLCAAYVGARRGESLFAYNQSFIKRRQRVKAPKSQSEDKPR